MSRTEPTGHLQPPTSTRPQRTRVFLKATNGTAVAVFSKIIWTCWRIFLRSDSRKPETMSISCVSIERKRESLQHAFMLRLQICLVSCFYNYYTLRNFLIDLSNSIKIRVKLWTIMSPSTVANVSHKGVVSIQHRRTEQLCSHVGRKSRDWVTLPCFIFQ